MAIAVVTAMNFSETKQVTKQAKKQVMESLRLSQ